MTNTDYDLAIVGGGPVGATLACSLGRHGARIALLEGTADDGALPPSYDNRTLALAFASRALLQECAVWRHVGSTATPIARIDIARHDTPGRTVLNADEEGVDAFGQVLSARALGVALYRELAECDVTVIRPARVVDVEPQRCRIRLVLADGAPRTAITAGLVVAADGAASTTRERAGIAAHRTDYGQRALVARVIPGVAHGNTAYERFTADGPLALLPLPAACGLVWSLPPATAQRLAAGDKAAFLDALQRYFGHALGHFRDLDQCRSYPLHGLRVDTLVRGRVVLAGNAAHTLHPIAGQGLNLGLRDVARLAPLIDDALVHGEDPGDSRRLALYAADRTQQHRRAFTFTDGLLTLFAQHRLPVRLLHGAGLAAFNQVAPIKHRLATETMGLAGRDRPPRPR